MLEVKESKPSQAKPSQSQSQSSYYHNNNNILMGLDLGPITNNLITNLSIASEFSIWPSQIFIIHSDSIFQFIFSCCCLFFNVFVYNAPDVLMYLNLLQPSLFY